MRLSAILRETVAEVKPAALERLDGLDFEDLSIALLSRLHDAGFAIHALDGRCVRVDLAVDDIGRPMTEAEAVATGAAQ